MKLEKILQIEKSKIQKIRETLFPLIGNNVITGFNIYENQFHQKSKYLLSYLHSELNPEDKHRQELIEKIKQYADIDIIQNMLFEIVDRHTSYKLKSGWKAGHYYTIKAKLLTETEANLALKRKDVVIGVDIQDDMKIHIDDYRELLQVIDVFNRYANTYVINKNTGKFEKKRKGKKLINIFNEKAIPGSWEIPLITLSTKEKRIPDSLDRIKEIGIDEDVYLSVLIDKKYEDFMFFLDQTKFKKVEKKEIVSANKVFVEWMNKNIYSRKYVEFMNRARTHH